MKQDDMTAQIEVTTRNLSELESELNSIPSRMSDAVDAADSKTMIVLRHRKNDLPIEIQMTRLRLERLRLQRKEATLPPMDIQIEALYEPIPALEKAYNEAKAALETARFALTDAIETRRSAKVDVGEMKRSLEQLKYQKA
jgi:prefoldin subunit 5